MGVDHSEMGCRYREVGLRTWGEKVKGGIMERRSFS